MSSLLDSVPEGGRVAVIRLRSLGDCVLTTPALYLLKRHRPDLRIRVAVEPRFAAIFEGNPDLDEPLAPTIGAVHAWCPHLCLNLHGGTSSAWMTLFSGARLRAGFGHFQFPFVYNVHIPRAQEILGEERTVHTAEHLASAMFYLGVPFCEIPRARLFTTPETVATPIAVIHPFAATPEKTWGAEGFLAVARHLRDFGIEPIFLGGPEDDLSAFNGFLLLGGAPLERVKEVIASASLFIGNDSGPAHIAAAFGVPVAVIFGNSNTQVWAPWRTASEIVTSPGGISAVSTEQVVNAIARLGVAA